MNKNELENLNLFSIFVTNLLNRRQTYKVYKN